MKLLHRVALAICLMAPAVACAPAVHMAEAKVQAATTTSPIQATSLKVAGDMFVLADHAGTAFMKSGKATPEQAKLALKIEGQLYTALHMGLDAERKGNSPAVAAALSEFNDNYAAIRKLVPGL